MQIDTSFLLAVRLERRFLVHGLMSIATPVAISGPNSYFLHWLNFVLTTVFRLSTHAASLPLRGLENARATNPSGRHFENNANVTVTAHLPACLLVQCSSHSTVLMDFDAMNGPSCRPTRSFICSFCCFRDHASLIHSTHNLVSSQRFRQRVARVAGNSELFWELIRYLGGQRCSTGCRVALFVWTSKLVLSFVTCPRRRLRCPLWMTQCLRICHSHESALGGGKEREGGRRKRCTTSAQVLIVFVVFFSAASVPELILG
jgi:hypothetical protein